MEELVKALEQIRDDSFNGADTLAVTYQWQTFAIELQGIADAALAKYRKEIGMNWTLGGVECQNCKGHGRVGIIACNACGATGRQYQQETK